MESLTWFSIWLLNFIEKFQLIFVLPFEISAFCNGSHLGSKITFGQVFEHKILGHFIFSKYSISVERKSSLNNLKYKSTNRQLKNLYFLHRGRGCGQQF
jgi:hypothetical protein